MYALFINISVKNWHFVTEGGTAMRLLIEHVYCMTWIWTLHKAHTKSKSPIEEDNIWAMPNAAVSEEQPASTVSSSELGTHGVCQSENDTSPRRHAWKGR